ncbi:MAG: hypothetical protein Q7S21_05215 [archaeon]|nr:hypothetical protein [archaeon]
MNFKEFIKLDIYKIALTLLFSLIFIIFTFSNIIYDETINVLLVTLYFPTVIIPAFLMAFFFCCDYAQNITLIYFFSSLFESYIFSIIVVYLYKKFKK